MQRHIAFFIFLTLSASTIFAQGRNVNKAQREQWMREMNQAKIEFITENLDLSKEQSEKFTSAYSAMENELQKLQRETRKMCRNINNKAKENQEVTDLEYEKAAEAVFELKGKEHAIEMRYFKQFSEILSKKQLYLLKNAEMKWTRELMKHRHRRHK